MSAEATRHQGGGRARQAAFSLVLIALAGGVMLKGLAFARLGAIEWNMERDAAAAALGAPAGATAPARAGLTPWLDEWGLRDRARLLYFSLGRSLSPAPPDGLQELTAVLAVDPVRSASWMDLAELTWPDLALRPTAMAAWELSRLTGPYEYSDMLRRTRFLARRWIFAPADRQRDFLYEVAVLQRHPDPFQPFWQQLLGTLPAPQRRLITEALQESPP
ncbi:hypothetical protein [Ancylobacter sp. IITR112]|uniref:hypothetical protein n=1 Tax=Ancylobacter sp. IITR112 TaxID=3138073 RepID=UPI00352BA34D